jgi:hypothetical protein
VSLEIVRSCPFTLTIKSSPSDRTNEAKYPSRSLLNRIPATQSPPTRTQTSAHRTSSSAWQRTQNARRACPNVVACDRAVSRDPAVYGAYIIRRARRLCDRQARAAYPTQNPAANISDRMSTSSIGSFRCCPAASSLLSCDDIMFLDAETFAICRKVCAAQRY